MSRASTPESGMNGQVPLKVDLLMVSLCTYFVSVLMPHAAIDTASAATNAATMNF
jgi:hypothetical protein